METSLLFIGKEGQLIPKANEFLTLGGGVIILELLKQIKWLLTEARRVTGNTDRPLRLPVPAPP